MVNLFDIWGFSFWISITIWRSEVWAVRSCLPCSFSLPVRIQVLSSWWKNDLQKNNEYSTPSKLSKVSFKTSKTRFYKLPAAIFSQKINSFKQTKSSVKFPKFRKSSKIFQNYKNIWPNTQLEKPKETKVFSLVKMNLHLPMTMPLCSW